MSEAMIELHRLGKRYESAAHSDGSWAVRGVTLTVFAGEVTVLMGPSGSGKTTLLTMIGGLLEPTEGFLSVCGVTLDDGSEPDRQRFRREKIGFVFQSCNLLQALTAEENVAVGLALRGEDPGQAQRLLEQVGLGAKGEALPEELSGGQRQRVAIARALAGSPPVLLADEPTAALDAEQGRLVMGLLRRRAKTCGTAVLVVTHDPRVRDLSDRVIEMEDGRLRRIVRRMRKPGLLPSRRLDGRATGSRKEVRHVSA
ncbi:MAG: ABC transporter ATP-binding protein [Planctomycetota bacterium]|nr:ABC transporter ATP-binding protein [Planctomycetota bacterium]